MKFVDEVRIVVKAGDGGPGAVSFRREKYVPKGGPDGGDGGKGGDVVIVASKRLQTLMDLSLKRRYVAENGRSGSKKNCFGSDGADLVIEVPIGTMIFDDSDRLIADLTEYDHRVVVATGGKGGLGNAHFATPTNRVPRYAQSGLPGNELGLRFELRLIAQVGLVGLPNAGKSTLLKALTRANPKIADYPFTTLFPNLGVLRSDDREIVVADIPGLIEGASIGMGLGSDFLRHVDRTQQILHLVALNLDGPEAAISDYRMIRNELIQSSEQLATKPVAVVLTKADLMVEEDVALYVQAFSDIGINPLVISSISGFGIDRLSKWLLKEVK